MKAAGLSSVLVVAVSGALVTLFFFWRRATSDESESKSDGKRSAEKNPNSRLKHRFNVLDANTIVAESPFRPRFHYTAPQNWLNDPCAPAFYNGTVHLFYQHSVHRAYWDAPIVWGHASSTDMVHWRDHQLALEPSESYDQVSVFTGSGFLEHGLEVQMPDGSRKRVPTIFYTGVTKLPIHWSRPYFIGAETQNMAYSLDGLKTWIKYSGNPVLPSEWNVTGWRDPFIFQDVAIDLLMMEMLHSEHLKSFYYILLGSGIRSFGGAVLFHYSEDLIEWSLSPLPLFSRSSKQIDGLVPDGYDSFSFGYNYEVPNLIPLMKADHPSNTIGENLYVLFFGTEGNAPDLAGQHIGVWLIGYLNVTGQFAEHHDEPETQRAIVFEPVKTGVLDHALLYAANSMKIPSQESNHTSPDQNHTHILFGWINEDWETDNMEREKFAGVIAVPRVLDLTWKTPNLEDASPQPYLSFNFIDNWVSKTCQKGCELFSALRLPLSDDSFLSFDSFEHRQSKSANAPNGTAHEQELPIFNESAIYIQVTFSVMTNNANQSHIGFTLKHGHEESTTISFSTFTRHISINRTHSSKNEQANRLTHSGYVPIHKENIRDQTEYINVEIIVDKSLVEVLVNGIVSVSSRIYPTSYRDGFNENDVSRVSFSTDNPNIAWAENLRIHWNVSDIWSDETDSI